MCAARTVPPELRLLLKEEVQQLDMMEFLLSRDGVTDEEALNEAHRLAEQK